MSITRRSVLKASVAIGGYALARPLLSATGTKQHIAVIGAGAFGGWTALYLLRAGARVTLLDSWGPGNSRASSGGETRVIRTIYGDREIYTKLAARALTLWIEHQKRWNRKIYTETGALWMITGDGTFAKSAIPILKQNGLPYRTMQPAEASKDYPQINFEGVHWALIEEKAGYLYARQACQIVAENFVAEGGEFRQVQALPASTDSNKLSGLKLSDGSLLKADQYVFACGPWLPKIFPDVVGNRIQPTRQEVFYFGTPAGDSRFHEPNLPVWINFAQSIFYGIPGNQYRGFKIADDAHGPAFDPTTGERLISPEALQAAKRMMELRFPGMRNAPLLESRICQYENSPDSHLILDRHPSAENVWILGGGSGHGFKFGPALGEWASRIVLEKAPAEPTFQLSRFKNA